VPDYPQETVTAAASAMCELHDLDPRWAETLAGAALDAAAPLLAEACAQAVIKHMETHGPAGRNTAWRRYMKIAARVAAGAFTSHDEVRRMAARVIAAGNYVACTIPEAGESES
jgi:hypothetical protein